MLSTGAAGEKSPAALVLLAEALTKNGAEQPDVTQFVAITGLVGTERALPRDQRLNTGHEPGAVLPERQAKPSD
jgi:hypothetical protein